MTMTLSGSGTIGGLVAGGLPDATITQPDLASGVAGNGPAFSAYMGTSQTITTATLTKLQFNTENFDTNNNYDNVTNYRFTPTVAGYYSICGRMDFNGSTSATRAWVSINKNGSEYKRGVDMNTNGSGVSVSNIIYLNGSTDYVELYGWISATTAVAGGGSNLTSSFEGCLVRAA